MITIAVSALLALLADQISKMLIVKNVFDMPYPLTSNFGATIPIIKDIFHLTFHGNFGMAFGMLSGNKILLLVLCFVILTGILVWCIKTKPKSPLQKISIGMITGGAIGNILDRILYGFVVDFLDFRCINYPIFNVADCFIVIGSVMLCVYFVFFDEKVNKIDNN